MPIFTTDKNGTPVRWTSKRTLSRLNEELGSAFVAERHEVRRLRDLRALDKTAWNHLMELYQEATERADLLAITLDMANDKNVEMEIDTTALIDARHEALREIRILREQRANDAAVLDESRRMRTSLSRRVAETIDERELAMRNLNQAQGCIARLIQERDEAQRNVAETNRIVDVLRAKVDCPDYDSHEAVIDSVDALLHACAEADAERMAAVGRSGRLGTKRIRTILGRS